MRTVHQAATARLMALRAEGTAGADVDRRWWGSLSSFHARLRWHCHFMQKLEDEPRIEFENFNPVYDGLREAFTESEEGRLRRMAQSLGLQEKVVFTGRVKHEDVPRYYDLVDIFC